MSIPTAPEPILRIPCGHCDGQGAKVYVNPALFDAARKALKMTYRAFGMRVGVNEVRKTWMLCKGQRLVRPGSMEAIALGRLIVDLRNEGLMR